MGSFLWHAFLDHRMISKLYHKIYNIRLIFFLFLFKSNSLSFWSISASTVLIASESSSYSHLLYFHKPCFNFLWPTCTATSSSSTNFETILFFAKTTRISRLLSVLMAAVSLTTYLLPEYTWAWYFGVIFPDFEYACRLGINHKWLFYFLAAISQITIYRRGSFI